MTKHKMNKKKLEEELALFYQSMGGTIPLSLSNKKIHIPLVKKNIYHNKKSVSLNKKPTFEFYEKLYLESVGSEDFISYKHPDLSNKIFKQLQKSQFYIDAVLDLHGFIADEAMHSVSHFIHQCLDEKIQVALIIHGKGHRNNVPILKNKLNHWLREIPQILAFCSATPMHGGNGAVYVLFKSLGSVK